MSSCHRTGFANFADIFGKTPQGDFQMKTPEKTRDVIFFMVKFFLKSNHILGVFLGGAGFWNRLFHVHSFQWQKLI